MRPIAGKDDARRRAASRSGASPPSPVMRRPALATVSIGSAPERLAARLRASSLPAIGRIRDGALVLDLRCLDEDALLLASLAELT